MQWLMTLRIALRALARNKLRAFLTMLGIIIGVGAVIAMVAIGEGAKSTIRSQISALGTNVLIILPGSNVQGGVRAGSGNVNTLVDADARAITRELRSVAYASPVLRRQEQLVAGNLNWGTLVQGFGDFFGIDGAHHDALQVGDAHQAFLHGCVGDHHGVVLILALPGLALADEHADDSKGNVTNADDRIERIVVAE